MKSKREVMELVEQLKTEPISISEKIWKVSLACVGMPYCFGAWGEECTPENRRKRTKADNSKCQVLNGKKSTCVGCKWFQNGERVMMWDCRGFTDWCLKQFGVEIDGQGCTSQWNDENNWSAKGGVENIPEDVITCLFYRKKDDKSVMAHTGLNFHGQTTECSVGVEYHDKRAKKWEFWAIPKGIGGDVPDYRPTLRKGDRGAYVTLAQTELINRGYDLGKWGADGKFGNATLEAVKAFQHDVGLVATGVIEEKTWKALDGEKPILYTVTIPHLTRTVAERFVAEAEPYSGATMAEEGGE